MDAGTAAVLAAAITGTVALAANVLGPAVGHWLARRDARQDRIRTLRLDQLVRAERSLILVLDLATAMADGDIGRAESLVATQRQMGHANPLLVGDPEAAKAWASACARVLLRVPKHRAAGLQVLLGGLRVTPEENAAIASARASVLAAMDKQRERVTADKPMAVVDPKQMAAAFSEMVEVEAAMARFGGKESATAAPSR